MLYIPLPVIRVCLTCGKTFHQHQLVKHKGSKDGVDSRCRPCHMEKVKKWQREHPERSREDRCLQQRKYRERHPDRVRQSKRVYYVNNKNKILEKDRQYRIREHDEVLRRERICRLKRSDLIRAANKRWAMENPELRRVARKRRQMKKKNLPATLTGKDWILALNYWHGACVYCGKGPSLFDQHQKLQQEHHIPVDGGGGYTPDNIVPACQSCNYSKKNRHPEKWVNWKFGKRKAKVILKRIQDYFVWVKDQK